MFPESISTVIQGSKHPNLRLSMVVQLSNKEALYPHVLQGRNLVLWLFQKTELGKIPEVNGHGTIPDSSQFLEKGMGKVPIMENNKNREKRTMVLKVT